MAADAIYSVGGHYGYHPSPSSPEQQIFLTYCYPGATILSPQVII
jgi:hypothetical protein